MTSKEVLYVKTIGEEKRICRGDNRMFIVQNYLR